MAGPVIQRAPTPVDATIASPAYQNVLATLSATQAGIAIIGAMCAVLAGTVICHALQEHRLRHRTGGVAVRKLGWVGHPARWRRRSAFSAEGVRWAVFEEAVVHGA
jgi:hypothetical protein